MIYGCTLACIVPAGVLTLITPILGVLAIVVCAVGYARIQTEWPNSLKARYVLGFLLFFGGYILSLLFGKYAPNSAILTVIKDVRFWPNLLFCPALVLAWNFFDSHALKKLISFITLVVLILSIWGIAQSLDGRALAYHKHPIGLAWQLLPWAVAGPWVYLINQNSRTKPIYWISVITAIMAGLLTGNRSFFVLVLLSIVSAILVATYLRSISIKSFIISTCIIAMSLLFHSPSRSRVIKFIKNPTKDIRYDLWKAQTRAFVDNPWYGVGRKQNRGILYKEYLPEKKLNRYDAIVNAHNLILDLLAGMGIAATLGFFLILIPIPRIFYLKATAKKLPHSAIITVAIFAWFSFSMIESPLEFPNVLTIVILGLSYLLANHLSLESKAASRR